MKPESIIRALTATVIPTGIVLPHAIAPAWGWLSVFAGINLRQSAFTGFCPPALILKRIASGKGGRP